MKKLARLHKFRANSAFKGSCFHISPGNPDAVSCSVDGRVWGDFGNIHRHRDIEHDYAFLMSKRVLDTLIAENLATFDAVRVRIDDIGDLRERDVTPEYYAIKVPQKLELNYYDGIGPGGAAVTYWIPDFIDYEGHPFVEVKTKDDAKFVLCIPRIAELAEREKWDNCAFSCLSPGGYYYSKEADRKAEKTFRMEGAIVAKEIFVEEDIVRNDLEAAKRKPQGHIATRPPAAHTPKPVENLNAEEIINQAIERLRQEKIKGLSTFSQQDKAWSFPCLLDTHFQKDVPVVFEDQGGLGRFPRSLPDNIVYLRENFPEVWNAFAATINELIETRGVPVPDSFALAGMKFTFSNARVSDSATWKLEISIKGIHHAFSADFKGLELQSASFQGSRMKP